MFSHSYLHHTESFIKLDFFKEKGPSWDLIPGPLNTTLKYMY